ncbi:hypothetical protein [Marinomonas foliarum]|uniref:Uncharacterized protein n=2 Tax=root TaxID=1 RepID=A0A899IRR7_9VIRU|nr:hypothetical protein [Marinomonas foliarum]QRV22797.1 hypothetical protein JSY38_12035 [Marinomonas foliarum]QSM01480.1 hypothetical protein [Marinomonas phage MfV]
MGLDALAGFGGLDMGGGSIAPSSSASNKGGTNLVGGTVFGDYNPASEQDLMPWVVGGVVLLLGAVFVLKKG